LISRLVESKAAAMVAADRSHEQELGDDQGPRATRDRAADHLATVLAGLRDALSAGYGSEAVKLYGLDGKLPTDPSVIGVLAESVCAKVKGGGIFSLADMDDLARKVRPSRRNPGARTNRWKAIPHQLDLSFTRKRSGAPAGGLTDDPQRAEIL
jgi:hypothetical protein